MNKNDFVEAHRHQLCGLVADAATTKATGGPLAVMLRSYFRKIDEELRLMWEELQPKLPPTNGKTNERHEGKAATPAAVR